MNILTSNQEEQSAAQITVPIAVGQWNESEFAIIVFVTPPLSLIAAAASRVADTRARIFSERPSISVF